MTEKRFNVRKSGNGLFYRDGNYEIDNTIQFIVETVEMKLNQLYEENEQLKSRVDYLGRKIERERNSTHKQYAKWEKEAEDKIKELSEENKQLKETIDELRTIDKEKDIEVEHINNIYKEFGFKGLIDYAKDKLYHFGAVREVEEGLWLLATGGWSDNEFWLDCLLDWSFMYAKGHYRATTRGGGYYYSEKPYADIKVILEDLE